MKHAGSLQRGGAAVSALLGILALAPSAQAQPPLFEVRSGPSFVVTTGKSEVLGPIILTASDACGNSADGHCVSAGGAITIRYLGVVIDNSLGSGVTISENIGGITTIAPTPGTLLTGAVTVQPNANGGEITFSLRGGIDLAANDSISITGIRARIFASAASAPGSSIAAELIGSLGVGAFSQTSVVVARSAVGLEFVSLVGDPVITFREGFLAVFVQHVAGAAAPLPANPRPAFGATNNTQLRLLADPLPGRILWPTNVPSQLAGGLGLAAGGSELQLISQDVSGREAIYEFVTANQQTSDAAIEQFAIEPSVCGVGTFGLQAQLFPEQGRPAFADPLIPTPAALFGSAMPCMTSPLAIVSGSEQIGIVGQELPQPLMVRAQDKDGNSVAGLTLNFGVKSGGGAVNPSTVVTDAAGQAQTTATLGLTPGPQSFTASFNDFTVTFFVQAVPEQVPPFPQQTEVPHVVRGAGFLTRILLVNLVEQPNRVQVNFLNPAGQLVRSQNLTVAPRGRSDVTTGEAERFGGLTIEWALVGSDAPLAAHALFEVKLSDSDTPLTAEDFLSFPAQSVFTLPVSFIPGGRTLGLALANAASESNRVELTLLDVVGEVKVQETFELAPFAQRAFALDESPAIQALLEGQLEFFGSLTLHASQPLAVLGAGLDSQRFFAVPGFPAGSCALNLFSPQKTVVFPHLPVGGGWSTRVMVTNLCASNNPVRFEVFDQSGAEAESFFPSSVNLLPRATAVFFPSEGQRFGPPQARWLRVTSDFAAAVHAVLDFRPNPGGELSGILGSAPPPVARTVVLPVGFSPVETVSLAVVNLAEQTNLLRLELVDRDGLVVAVDSSLELPAQGQIAVVLSQLPGFAGFVAGQANFQGSLRVVAELPVAVFGVANDAGVFFALPPISPPDANP